MIKGKGEGPTLVKPKPYYSCSGCKYFEQTMVRTGGLKGTPLYTKECYHPSWENPPYRPLTNKGLRGVPFGNNTTPSWCPFLNNDNDNEGQND